MTDGLNPYSAYNDSGVPWLGEVSGHWEVHPNGSLRGPFLRPSPASARRAEGEGPRTVGWAKAVRPCPAPATNAGHAALCPSYAVTEGLLAWPLGAIMLFYQRDGAY